ncbi:hypothetical protein M1O16_04340 [Dehalococcoidia bacterium]|nr:hypothetical protein [Dehalococcoidia bacterium]
MREKAKMDGEKAKKIDEGKHEDGWRKGEKRAQGKLVEYHAKSGRSIAISMT